MAGGCPGEGGSAPAHERARDAQWGSSGLPLRAVGASKDFSPTENRSAGNRITLAARVQRMGFKQLFTKHGLGIPRVPLPENPRGQTIFIIILRTHLPFSAPFFCEPTVEFLRGPTACVITMDWMQKQMRVQLSSLEPNVEKRFSQKAQTALFCLLDQCLSVLRNIAGFHQRCVIYANVISLLFFLNELNMLKYLSFNFK